MFAVVFILYFLFVTIYYLLLYLVRVKVELVIYNFREGYDMEFAASFSGGKDSILAIKKMIDRGNRLVALVVSTIESQDISWTHSLSKEYFEEVAEILKCEVIFTDSMINDYELCFENALRIAKNIGAQACIFGDIDIEQHLKWNKDRCDSVGLECIHPLMFIDRKSILENLLATKFIARIKKVDNSKLAEAFIGRTLSPDTINDLEKCNIDLCGENGEYHTVIELDSIEAEFSRSESILSEIYVDNASTCFPKAPGVSTEVMSVIDNQSYSINRGTYIKSYELQGKIIDVREKIKSFFNTPSDFECIFSPSATYSINQILMGLLEDGDILLTGDCNHNSSTRLFENLKSKGVKVVKKGKNEIESYLSENQEVVKGIFITQTNNITGENYFDQNEISKISEKCKIYNTYFILDIVQTVCEDLVDISRMGVDAVVFSPHIGLMSVEGVGVSLMSKSLSYHLKPVIFGGNGSNSDSDLMPNTVPDKFEVGTLNIPAILGIGKAIDYIDYVGIEKVIKKRHDLGNRLRTGLSKIENSVVLGHGSFCLLNVEGHDMSMLGFYLDSNYSIQTRVGIHCSHETHRCVGTFPHGGIRFSLGYFNTKREIDKIIEEINVLIQ